LKIIGAAFGEPLSPTTFSGLSCRLFSAVKERGYLIGTLSTAAIKKTDAFRGSLTWGGPGRFFLPRLSRRWLWKMSTVHLLSARANCEIARWPDAEALLQVGTHVYPRNHQIKHFCVTDMTIARAYSAKMFDIGCFSRKQLAEANAAQRTIFDSCHAVFVLSEWIRQSVIDDYAQAPSKVIAIGAGANIEPLDPAPEKYDSKNILFVGFNWRAKGGPLLLEAFQRVRERIPDATLTIIGDGPASIPSGAEALGRLSRSNPEQYAQLKRAYQRANCFCLLSEFDAFPNVLLEAQYTGTPVVALNRQSRPEAVQDGITGILVTAADPQEVADGLISILGDPEGARRMGEQGRALVRTKFTWPIVCDRFCNHMLSFVNGSLRTQCRNAPIEATLGVSAAFPNVTHS